MGTDLLEGNPVVMVIIIFDYYYFIVEHGRLAEMVSELSTGLSGVKHEQEYMEVRERIHRMSKLRFYLQGLTPAIYV